MSPTAIFVIGVFTTALCICSYMSRSTRSTPPGVTVVHGLLPVAESMSPLDTPPPHLRIKITLELTPNTCAAFLYSPDGHFGRPDLRVQR